MNQADKPNFLFGDLLYKSLTENRIYVIGLPSDRSSVTKKDLRSFVSVIGKRLKLLEYPTHGHAISSKDDISRMFCNCAYEKGLCRNIDSKRACPSIVAITPLSQVVLASAGHDEIRCDISYVAFKVGD